VVGGRAIAVKAGLGHFGQVCPTGARFANPQHWRGCFSILTLTAFAHIFPAVSALTSPQRHPDSRQARPGRIALHGSSFSVFYRSARPILTFAARGSGQSALHMMPDPPSFFSGPAEQGFFPRLKPPGSGPL
jgi:hypothetical protein